MPSGVYTFSNVWLSIWSAQDDVNQIKSATTNITIYGAMGIAQGKYVCIFYELIYKKDQQFKIIQTFL